MIRTFLNVLASGSLLLFALNFTKSKGATQKSVTFVFCLVFLVTLTANLPGSLKDLTALSPSRVKADGLNSTYTALTYATVEYLLKANNINYKSLTLETHTAENGEITLKGIKIISSQGEKIRQILPNDILVVENEF